MSVSGSDSLSDSLIKLMFVDVFICGSLMAEGIVWHSCDDECVLFQCLVGCLYKSIPLILHLSFKFTWFAVECVCIN